MKAKYLNIYSILCVLLLSACGQKFEKPIKLEKQDMIVAFGDSLTFGQGAKEEESYPAKMQDLTGYKIINEGLNGDTAKNGKMRIKEVIEEHEPKLIILGLGGNDMLRNQEGQLKSDLSEMISYIKGKNIQVVLLATPKPDVMRGVIGALSDAEVYELVAKEQNIFLIDNLYSKYLSKNDLKSDPIHLNSKGYDLVANEIAKRLKAEKFIDY